MNNASPPTPRLHNSRAHMEKTGSSVLFYLQTAMETTPILTSTNAVFGELSAQYALTCCHLGSFCGRPTIGWAIWWCHGYEMRTYHRGTVVPTPSACARRKGRYGRAGRRSPVVVARPICSMPAGSKHTRPHQNSWHQEWISVRAAHSRLQVTTMDQRPTHEGALCSHPSGRISRATSRHRYRKRLAHSRWVAFLY